MKQIILLISLIFTQFITYSQNSISVNDPQNWGQSSGNIENLELRVQPKGLYAEVSYTFDLSTDDIYSSETQLEWVWQFEIDDPNLIFNDSWLWIDDYISKGEIYDKGEGVDIYEGIVNRRQDPSILTKESQTRYVLKVYPLFADSTRRVKISYLTPLQVHGNMSSLDIDISIFENSLQSIQEATLIVTEDSDWIHFELPSELAQPISTVGNYTSYRITNFDEKQNLEIDFQRQNNSTDFYFGTYQEGTTNYYQLNFTSTFHNDRQPTYHVFAIDYVAGAETSLEKERILTNIKRYTSQNLRENDYINFIYSDFGHRLYTDEYLLATDANIERAIHDIENEMDGLGSFLDALSTGVHFIHEQEENASLTIISSSTNLGSEVYLDEIEDGLQSLLNASSTSVTLNLINIAEYGPYHWINNERYYGNQYLYLQLSRLTDGVYFDLSEYTFGEALSFVTSSHISEQNYDISVDPQDGFSFSNYLISRFQNGIVSGEDIMITGKYLGDFPIQVKLNGVYNDEVFEKSFTVSENETVLLDNYAKKAWTANYIRVHEKSELYLIRQEVIDASKEERLLSTLTTFLCLEGDTIQTIIADDNGDVLDTATEISPEEAGITVFPNPASEQFTIKIPESFMRTLRNDHIRVYNTTGDLCDIHNLEITSEEDKHYIHWTPSESFIPGIYILQISNGKVIVNLKVVYIT